MKQSRFVRASVAFVAAAFVVACGAADRSEDDGSNGGNGTGAGVNGGVVLGDTPGGVGGGSGTSSPNAKCAGTAVAAAEVPVYLVFMFDKSGSMGGNALATRWTPCSNALKAFLEDGRSKGLHATLDFFPRGGDICQVDEYASTSSALRTLPEPAGAPVGSLTEKLLGVTPDGDTPTIAALKGAITTAKDVRANVASKDGGKVAVVLVTDGEPRGCDGNSIGTVAAAARAVNTEIPTYVIGVGNIQNLDRVAEAGDPAGTRRALKVEPNPAPGQPSTADQFFDALAQIRGATLSCDYTLPPAPAGKTLDIGAVNVVYTAGNGTATTFPYDKGCTAGGWRYDDPTNPTKISLCKAACDTVKADKTAKLDIELGCTTKGTDGQIPK